MMVIMILRFRKIDRSVKLFKDCSTLEHIIDHNDDTLDAKIVIIN